MASVMTLFNEHQPVFKDIRINRLEKVPVVGTGPGRRVELVKFLYTLNIEAPSDVNATLD